MNAFASIAKPAGSTKTATKKILASVTPTIKSAVDEFVSNKAIIKSLEAKQSEHESIIIDHVRAQQDSHAFSGDFSKSFLVAGHTAEVTYMTSDRFSVPQDEETLKELKKTIGDKKYNDFFETKPTIALKESVVRDDAMLNKIAAACEKAGMPIAEIFTVANKVIAKDNLDEKQYTLPEDKLPMFRAIVRQNKPALK